MRGVRGVELRGCSAVAGRTTVASGRSTAVDNTASQPPATRLKPRAITSKSATAAATHNSQLRSVAGSAARALAASSSSITSTAVVAPSVASQPDTVLIRREAWSG